jgi:small-conductance mechanosensitive channel/CRP-like cAMP-binding protein
MQAAYSGSIAMITNPLALAGALLVAGMLVTRFLFQESAVGKFLCKLASFAGFTAMLAVAQVSPLKPTAAMDTSFTYLMISTFKIVWWLAAAWLLAGFVRAGLIFQRKPMETRFLQDLGAGAIYIGAILGIIDYVFDIPVSGLLAASGVAAIVLGLALQSTLGDVFSGVVLNFTKPYAPGDWVILDGGMQGRIIQSSWRATQILNIDNDMAFVPNSLIARGKLVNASRPSGAHGITVVVRLEPTMLPSAGVAVLMTALLGCSRILRTPPATVTVRSLDALALECELQVFVALIEQAPDAQNEVFDLVFRHCVSAGIRLAPPSGSAVALPTREPPVLLADVPGRLLERLSIFRPLSIEERKSLAPRMTRRTYKPGDTLVEQGVVADALVILTSGVLVALRQHDGVDVEVLRLAPGDCFCEASVLTGATTTFKVVALTRVTVYQIFKADLMPILKARPAIAADLGLIMARREVAGKMRLEALEDSDKHPDHLATRLAERMKLMFNL